MVFIIPADFSIDIKEADALVLCQNPFFIFEKYPRGFMRLLTTDAKGVSWKKRYCILESMKLSMFR